MLVMRLKYADLKDPKVPTWVKVLFYITLINPFRLIRFLMARSLYKAREKRGDNGDDTLGYLI